MAKATAKTKAAAKATAKSKSKAAVNRGNDDLVELVNPEEATNPEETTELEGKRISGWATDSEFIFLSAQIPEYLRRQKMRAVQPFLIKVADAFLKKYKSRVQEFPRRDKFIKVSMFFSPLSVVFLTLFSQKLRDWYGNHTRKIASGSDERRCLNITGTANRKPLRLQRAQAYSILYYHEGSELEKEIRLLYKRYKAGHAETVSRFQPLFKKLKSDNTVSDDDPEADDDGDGNPGVGSTQDKDPEADDDEDPGTDSDDGDEPGTKNNDNGKCVRPSIIPKYLPFQQAAIREIVKTLPPDVDATVENYINTTYDAALKVWESPWLASVKPGGAVDDLQMKYYRKLVFQCSVALWSSSHIFRNVERLGHTLQVASEEVTRQTAYKTFFMWGGPSAVAPATVDFTAYVYMSSYINPHNNLAASEPGGLSRGTKIS